MKYIAAYILLSASGKTDITSKDILGFLQTIGGKGCAEEAEMVVESLKGKNLHELSNKGLSKLSTMSFGGSASASTGAPAQSAAAKPAKEEKKEEKVEEVEDVDLGGMFD